MRKTIGMLVLVTLIVGAFGCASMTNQQKGAIIGAAGGGAIGALIGENNDNTALGAIVGAAVGGTAGAIIGDYMDDQAEELNADVEGAKIKRVDEGIQITFDSGILFDVNKADLRPEAKANLTNMAEVLNKYPDTDILIAGHTDADGTEEYNQSLSERRANSVSVYLLQNNVRNARMRTIGHGESLPIADNATAAGKQANRRVEVAIMANEQLKKQAEQQAAQG